jgi:nicotinate-nucleotide adenylyltransferase
VTPPITPLPLPPTATSILLFGGTFDPPHRAHIQLAAQARDAVLGPTGWLLFTPAARSPLKSAAAVATNRDRLNMLRLATRGLQNTAIWTDELDRGPPSYTIDTVRRARQLLGPLPTLRLLIGADQAAIFHHWRDFRDLFREAQPVVLLRAPFGDKRSLQGALKAANAWTEAEIERWLDAVADLPPIDVSSTGIRTALGPGNVDAAVGEYIRERGLYAAAGAEKKPGA